MVTVRQGGPDPALNPRLRLAIQSALDNNMPMEKIERVIERAVGGGEGQEMLEEGTYEGYGPGGVAILLQFLTSNRNRTASEVRSTFTRMGGNLGEAGCVAWNFESKGAIRLAVDPPRAEDVALLAIDAGAEDVRIEGGDIEVYTTLEGLESVRRELEGMDVAIASAELSMVPRTTVSLGEREAVQTLRLLDRLEELDDVQKVYSNADFPDTVLEQYQKEG